MCTCFGRTVHSGSLPAMAHASRLSLLADATLLCHNSTAAEQFMPIKSHHKRSLFHSSYSLVVPRSNRVPLTPGPLKVEAIDPAQAFDYEAKKSQELKEASRLKIGIVGFGNYGQFLAKRIVKQGHTVLVHSRTNYSDIASQMGISYFRDPDDFCEEHPEVVLICTSILSTAVVLQSLPLQRLKRNTLFVDVLSVKEFPRNLFLKELPSEFDILCTHPMFGPQSGKSSWSGLPFVYDKVRVGKGPRAERCQNFLKIFNQEGCRMVEMSCVDHDRYAAGSQFITHTVGRVLGQLALESTSINTKGYEQLLHLVENTNSDSFELYYGLFMYNANATEQLERLELAFDSVKKQLFTKVHDILRRQMFGAGDQGVSKGSTLPDVCQDNEMNGAGEHRVPNGPSLTDFHSDKIFKAGEQGVSKGSTLTDARLD